MILKKLLNDIKMMEMLRQSGKSINAFCQNYWLPQVKMK